VKLVSKTTRRRIERNQHVFDRQEVKQQLDELSGQQKRVEIAKMAVTNAENRMQLLARCAEVIDGTNAERAPLQMQEEVFNDGDAKKIKSLITDVCQCLNDARIDFVRKMLNYLDEVSILLSEHEEPSLIVPSTGDVIAAEESKE
jgi:hypothetical protein